MRSHALLLTALCAAACRPDPGVPDYSAFTSLFADGGATASLPGPFPFVPGARRVSFGTFYEGGASERAPIDDYFIFSSSYLTTPSDDRVEGLQSDELDFTGTAFWGGGLFYGKPTDLSGWTSLHVSFKSADPGLAVIALRVLSYGPAPANQEQTFALNAATYGWVNDGACHSLVVPLADFVAEGFDPGRVRSPFTIGNDPAAATAKAGETLLVDDVYFN